MHLKSTNGPIDVLVCPETETETEEKERERDQQPLLSPSHSATSCSESTPHKMVTSHGSSTSTAGGLMSSDENDISLSSIIDAATTEEDLDCLLQYGRDYYALDHDGGTLLPTFESLSPPPLQEGDFHFGLDVTEGIGDLFDLS